MEQKKKKIPMRQCLGCSGHFPKSELLRVVRAPDGTGPMFAAAPEDTKVHLHDPLTLVAYAPTAVSYQWLKDGEPVAGTGVTLSAPLQAAYPAGAAVSTAKPTPGAANQY